MTLILFAACLKSTSQPSSTTSSDFCSPEKDWSVCLEKEVSLSAKRPPMLYQHPLISSPTGVDSVQNYIEVEERQIIALSEEQNVCSEVFVAQGVLKKISLGGAPGTKGSYENYYLSQTRFLCK